MHVDIGAERVEHRTPFQKTCIHLFKCGLSFLNDHINADGPNLSTRKRKKDNDTERSRNNKRVNVCLLFIKCQFLCFVFSLTLSGRNVRFKYTMEMLTLQSFALRDH